MGIIDTFSKRKKKLEQSGAPDVYVYEPIPQQFRVQVIHIWRSTIGRWWTNYASSSPANPVWQKIHNAIAREKGLLELADGSDDPEMECEAFLLQRPTLDALDIIEYSFRVIDRVVRKRFLDRAGAAAAQVSQSADDAIAELNDRFAESALGYQYLNGELVRIDSQLAHAEIVKPALSLLSDPAFAGASEEFMKAFEHYRHGRNKEAVAEALKAFESTMKSICTQRGWTAPPNATAQPLIEILFRNGLVPAELQSHFGALRSALESGLPTLSNRTSRHGQGPTPQPIPDYLASYALHLAASDIVFLVRANAALP